MNALITEQDRLYYFYIACNMSKEETCKAMGYLKRKTNTPLLYLVELKLKQYRILKPNKLATFNKRRGMYQKYGVVNAMQSIKFKKKIQETNLKKYGVAYYTQTADYKIKSKQTCLKKYGVDNATKLKSTQDKMKATNMQRYGAENVYASEYGKNKIKETNLKRYGVTSYTKTKEYLEKTKQTDLLKYGTEFHTQAANVKEKICRTNLERYGVTNVFAATEIKERIKNTNIKRYGVDNCNKIEEVHQKIKDTCRKKYGVDNYTQTKEYRIKSKQTCLQKYGVDNVSKSKATIAKIYKVKKENKSLNASKDETIIRELLQQKFKNVRTQYRSELYPFACDFYIPELNLYIEYQGLWTHGKRNKITYGPFDSANPEHFELLNIWKEKSKNSKYYKQAIKVWTISDPLKRKTAINNKLNWIEFFDITQFMDWYNSI